MKPFVKWAGGKAKLAERLASMLPPRIDNYIEPFVGGGALFWRLASDRERWIGALLNDKNEELITAYRVIQGMPDELMNVLDAHERLYAERPEDYYYDIRNRSYEGYSLLAAARFIFLNKAGFNGLYRVNRQGGFNVPWGKRATVKLYDRDNILACSKALREVLLHNAGYEGATKLASAGDAVYFDPPYVPVSKSANFTSYTKDGFGLGEQERLADIFRELVGRGVTVLLSNADSDYIRDLYKGFPILDVEMRRNINSKGGGRAPVREVVVVGRP